MPNKLSKDEEKKFQDWYKAHAEKLGLHSDPDHPRHNYDYRKAWKSGTEPVWQPEHQQYRWPDEFYTGDIKKKRKKDIEEHMKLFDEAFKEASEE